MLFPVRLSRSVYVKVVSFVSCRPFEWNWSGPERRGLTDSWSLRVARVRLTAGVTVTVKPRLNSIHTRHRGSRRPRVSSLIHDSILLQRCTFSCILSDTQRARSTRASRSPWLSQNQMKTASDNDFDHRCPATVAAAATGAPSRTVKGVGSNHRQRFSVSGGVTELELELPSS